MTIATNRPDGWPQATTVGYVNDGFLLYCFVANNTQKHANILRDAEILEAARRDAVDFIARPPSEEELRRAVAYIRDHWQRRYALVTVG